MEWHINDLSLSGQFADSEAFRVALIPILQLRAKRDDLKSRIFCSRTLLIRPVTVDALNLQQAVLAVRDKNYTRSVLAWMSSAGPFWDDSRAPNAEDLFYFENEDVTDQGLGEAARRLLLGIEAHTYSLTGPAVRLQRSPLRVDSLRDPQVILNFWETPAIEAEVGRTKPGSWRHLLELAGNRLPNIILAPEITKQLRPSPFNSRQAEKILELLGILDQIVLETLPDSSLTPAGMELIQKFFQGANPPFTDESASNKSDFEKDLSFPDPTNGQQILFCPWHGKISLGFFRLHFEWPRPRGQRSVKVVYVGPKITKH
jgi:hypothetical protein